jgi:REP element-mobilizing transposase RayT
MGYDTMLEGRTSIPDQPYFITTVTAQRLTLFTNWQVGRLLVLEMRRLHLENKINSLAWVIMPDHLHWLFILKESNQLPEIMQLLKGRSSRTINQFLDRKGPIWQKGYYERAVRQEEDLRSIGRYIVANPLRAKIVNSLGGYSLWDAVWVGNS